MAHLSALVSDSLNIHHIHHFTKDSGSVLHGAHEARDSTVSWVLKCHSLYAF